MPYRSRHNIQIHSTPPARRYMPHTWKEYRETPLHVDEGDEARLAALDERIEQDTFDQADKELHDSILSRKEDRADARCAPLCREIKGYFEKRHLPPLPAPLPKSSLWVGYSRPCFYKPEEVGSFYVACEEGALDEVKRYIGEKKDVLGSVTLRDGLDCAAMGNQVHVARYLVEEIGVQIPAHAVISACKNRSLPLFELLLRHGYHPNQQVPSNCGHFGTALRHCLDNDAITLLLLESGADPNVAPFRDGRNRPWSQRAVVPMERISGLPLDLATKTSSLAVIKKLLECGANPKYSRPLHRVIRDRPAYIAAHPDMEDDWRAVMQLTIDRGANINARTWWGGTALTAAVSQDRWDVVRFLLGRGADPRTRRIADKEDSFVAAARAAGIPWEESEELRGYLDRLCEYGPGLAGETPGGAGENPLVRFIVEAGKGVGND